MRCSATPAVIITLRPEFRRCVTTPWLTTTPPPGFRRSLATPWASKIPPSGPVHSLATPRAASIQLSEAMRSMKTNKAPATATPPPEPIHFLTTPRVASIRPVERVRSLAIPRASKIPRSGPVHSLTTKMGFNNTAIGLDALLTNTTGNFNTAIGTLANVSAENLTNATAIGAGAGVTASNKIRLGNTQVTVIEGQVPFTASSDKTKKENFKPVDGEEVLGKIRGFELTSWNFIGHDPKEFRHYGPMAQDFFAAFGHDGVGRIGTETTINSGDIAG